MQVFSPGPIGDDLKAILYSLEFQPGFDVPVKVPPDVQELLDKYRNDVVSHDVEKVMTHFSDGFLDSGTRKGEIKRYFRQVIDSIMSLEVGITDFVAAGDRAYLAGFVMGSWGKSPMPGSLIVKENGEWRFYGNQRDAAP